MSDLQEWVDDVDQRLDENDALARAAKIQAASTLEGGKFVHPQVLAGIAKLETATENLRAYRDARAIALGLPAA